MKKLCGKRGVLRLVRPSLFLVVLVLLSFSFVLAQDANATDTVGDVERVGEDLSVLEEAIVDADMCLDKKVGSCASRSIREKALVVLASAASGDSYSNCAIDLQSDQKPNGGFGSIEDTALAILALHHAGVDTTVAQDWLLKQETTPSEMTWFLQQNSDGAATCSVSYGGNDHEFLVGENKKISRNAGSCLSRSDSEYWFEIRSSCLEEEYTLACDQNFLASFLYKNKNSPTIHVFEGSVEGGLGQRVDLVVNSKCFGKKNNCDYEATLWSSLALAKTRGLDAATPYIPYLVALSDTKGQYLPDAFLLMLSDANPDVTNRLLSSRELAGYWKAPGTAHNLVYDTALATIALGDGVNQASDAKEWLWSRQKSDGCWNNNVADTAMALWALEGRFASIDPRNPDIVVPLTCSAAGGSCVSGERCNVVSSDGSCTSPGLVCCTQDNLKSCSELSGTACSASEQCTGSSVQSSDRLSCCIGSCVPKITGNACESSGYDCRSSCFDGEVEESLSCSSGSEVCCGVDFGPGPDEGSSVWWWILLLLVVALVILGFVFREKLKPYWEKVKGKFKKGDKNTGVVSNNKPPFPPRPGSMPPRPGVPVRPNPMGARPPVVPPRGMPPKRSPVAPRTPLRPKGNDDMSDTFKKLKEMTGE
jgi:hypothetical protein